MYVTEGEKACNALLAKGIPADGTVCGAATIPSDAVLRVLVGRRIKLYPDNDDPGRRHMQRIAERLRVLTEEANVSRQRKGN